MFGVSDFSCLVIFFLGGLLSLFLSKFFPVISGASKRFELNCFHLETSEISSLPSLLLCFIQRLGNSPSGLLSACLTGMGFNVFCFGSLRPTIISI